MDAVRRARSRRGVAGNRRRRREPGHGRGPTAGRRQRRVEAIDALMKVSESAGGGPGAADEVVKVGFDDDDDIQYFLIRGNGTLVTET